MNALVPRFLKSAYRKEPISSFIVIVGAVNAVLGGVGERWTLLSFGVIVMLTAAMLRWWKIHKAQATIPDELPRRFLAPSSPRSPLPLLTSEKQRR
jgi:hypothetical protein